MFDFLFGACDIFFNPVPFFYRRNPGSRMPCGQPSCRTMLRPCLPFTSLPHHA
jgi:hypothetical protein